MLLFLAKCIHYGLQEKELRIDETLRFTCKCSFLEIYNEQILDLLNPNSVNLQVIHADSVVVIQIFIDFACLMPRLIPPIHLMVPDFSLLRLFYVLLANVYISRYTLFRVQAMS
jgi:hypothetical protein